MPNDRVVLVYHKETTTASGDISLRADDFDRVLAPLEESAKKSLPYARARGVQRRVAVGADLGAFSINRHEKSL